LLAHEVLNPVWAVAARFGVGAAVPSSGDIHRAVKAPEYRKAARLVASDHEPKHG